MKLLKALGTTAALLSSKLMADTLIITDVDDTARQSNVLNKMRAAKLLIKGARPFNHLISLYQQIEGHIHEKGEVADFLYVSSAPKPIIDVEKWLEKFRAPSGEVIQRHAKEWATGMRAVDFKVSRILEYFEKYPEKLDWNIIFVGDNGEADPEVYRRLRSTALIRNKNVQIYIRDIRANATRFHAKLPVVREKGIKYFFTELDLLKTGDFDFVSDDYKKSIAKAITRTSFIPDFVVQELEKRAKKEGLNAEELIENYLRGGSQFCKDKLFSLAKAANKK